LIGQPSVSIIIPCKDIDKFTKDCVNRCKQLNYEDYEIILLPDNTPERIDKVRIISTGPVTPGAKRNIGVSNSLGEICAFIDSDAYPRSDWLSNAAKYFEDPQIAAVGGPGLTPKEDGSMQRASGFVLSSYMVGNLSKRYKCKGIFESDDIHSCNFLARKSILVKIGGWSEKYWPGEDTLICRAIKGLGKKLIEAPDVVIYHHRRPLFRKHLKQVSSYGLHRGFFARRFKENSRKPPYLAPTFLVSFLIAGGILSFANNLTFLIFSFLIGVYLVLCFVASLIQVKDLKLILIVWSGIVLTHLCYGASFIIGFSKNEI